MLGSPSWCCVLCLVMRLIKDSARGASSLVSPIERFCGVSYPAADWIHAERRQRFSLLTAGLSSEGHREPVHGPQFLLCCAGVRSGSQPGWAQYYRIRQLHADADFSISPQQCPVSTANPWLALLVGPRDSCPEVGVVSLEAIVNFHFSCASTQSGLHIN